jgi:hypothetical protein
MGKEREREKILQKSNRILQYPAFNNGSIIQTENNMEILEVNSTLEQKRSYKNH